MPFWKQSDDPWNKRDGISKPPKPPKRPPKSPIDSLKQWNEERKSAAKEREESKRLPPEKCPWCGKDMEQGFLLAGRDPIRWYPGVFKTVWFMRDQAGSFRIDTEEDIIVRYRVAWLCRACGKMAFDMPEPLAVNDPFAAHPETEETKEEDMSEE